MRADQLVVRQRWSPSVRATVHGVAVNTTEVTKHKEEGEAAQRFSHRPRGGDEAFPQVRLGAEESGWDALEPLNHFCPHHLGPQKVSSYPWAAGSPTEPGINISLLPPQAS